MRTVRIVVRGRVQGVGYREWTVAEARTLELVGWVRNRCDGSVEILAVGDDAAIAEMIRRCGRGPAMANVADVAVTEADEAPATGFTRLPTI